MSADVTVSAEALLGELREGRRLLATQTLELDALRASERRLRLIADHLPAFVAYVDATDLRYRWVNHRFVSGFGRPRADLIGSHVRDVIGAPNYEFALPFIEQVRAGRAASYENDFSIEQGPRRIRVNYVPDVAEDGAVIGIIVLSYDVTEVTRATAALRESEQRRRRAAVLELIVPGPPGQRGREEIFSVEDVEGLPIHDGYPRPTL